MENLLNPYEGSEPFVFVSYSHKDSEKVFSIIQKLQAAGLRIWYDKGIEWGSEWPDYIADHIRNCKCFIAFHSENSKNSRHCKQEIYFATKHEKDIFSIYLEDVKFNPGIEMQLAPFQATYFYQYPVDKMEEFYSTLLKSRFLQPCCKRLEQKKGEDFKENVAGENDLVILHKKEKEKVLMTLEEFKKSFNELRTLNDELEEKMVEILNDEDDVDHDEKNIIPIIFILDTSGSMYGNPIEKLNKALKKTFKCLREHSRKFIVYKVAVITFGSSAKVFMDYNTYDLPPIEAGGTTSFGAALCLAKNMIEDSTITPEEWLNPKIILVTDGYPTDDYEESLNDFITTGRSAKCLRYAVGVGDSFDREVLKRFDSHFIEIEDPSSIEGAFQTITNDIIARGICE